ncbi:DUF1799 domain-containing protein [Pseudomonas sp. NPDC087598]|uniref:DUF1799 domain-containing protein n=1 Tax=Pseudomonas sp. NPDC087598 TaxID=3364440 RepID=UPI00382B3419
MYEPGPSEADLAAFGLSISDIPEEECEVLAENWPAFVVFNAMSTQWRTGMGGATGLDYTVLRDVSDFVGTSRKQLREIFPDLQAMEVEALLVMSESK